MDIVRWYETTVADRETGLSLSFMVIPAGALADDHILRDTSAAAQALELSDCLGSSPPDPRRLCS